MSLHALFQTARRDRRALFFPYFCVGYPNLASSIAFADAALTAGAAGLELGVPFSDPIADGPTLQKATQYALDHGTKFTDVFKVVRALRAKGHRQPLLVMTYLNPIAQMGWEKFTDEVVASGAQGALVPDLPLEECSVANRLMKSKGLSLIPFLAPTSSSARRKKIDALGAPFLYYVSLTGVTGARKKLSDDLAPKLRALRRTMRTPVTVGFGISTPDQAAQVGRDAEGVIIGSAFLKLIDGTAPPRRPAVIGRFCQSVVKRLRGA